jgi:YHS domain-containing protein
MFKDPICGMIIDERTAKHVSQTKGGSVYLCSDACKSRFDASEEYDTNYNNNSSNCGCCH